MAVVSAKGLIILSLGALLMLVMLAQPADASSLTAYQGPGCYAPSTTWGSCGCYNFPTNRKGGYRWTYTGQRGAAYNSYGCAGTPYRIFTSSSNGCSAFGWYSFRICY